MGQQQLLLIVLGVIIVGIAVVVGINVFTAQSEESTKDSVVSDCTNLGTMAQQYYRKPIAMGGGGNTFDASSGSGGTAWDVPANLDTTASDTYSATVRATVVTITGNPLAATNYSWIVTTVVTAQNITSSISESAPPVIIN